MFDRIRNLLRPPEAKASRTARLIALESPWRPRWTPRDYAALAREGYVGNAVVHRAVKLVAENAASCAFLLYEGAAERDRHPLLDILTRPDPRQDGAALFEALHTYLLLAGNAYVEAVTVEGAVREFYCLRPDRMRVVPGADGWAESYEHTAAGRTVRFDQNAPPLPPILHLTAFHPLDDHYGLAPLEAAAAVAVDTHNSAAHWNKALLDNSARPSGALVYDGPEGSLLSDGQYERLKRQLEETGIWRRLAARDRYRSHRRARQRSRRAMGAHHQGAVSHHQRETRSRGLLTDHQRRHPSLNRLAAELAARAGIDVARHAIPVRPELGLAARLPEPIALFAGGNLLVGERRHLNDVRIADVVTPAGDARLRPARADAARALHGIRLRRSRHEQRQ
jgi:hypothetical protein